MRIVDEQGGDAPTEDDIVLLEEARTWRVRPPAAEDVRACRLGPVRLARDADGSFVLPVGHAVGDAVLVVETATSTRRLPVRLVPREEKLDAASWSALVNDLGAWLPGVLVGLSEASLGSVRRDGVPAGLLAAAVVPLVPALVQAVEAVVREPRTREHRVEEPRRMHTIRRASADTLRWLGRHPTAVVLAKSEAGDAGGDPWVSARVLEVSLDHPANRAVRWYAEQVGRRLRVIAEALRTAAKGLFDPEARWCEASARVLADGADALDRAVARSFLKRLAAEPPGPTALLALADDPTYARVLRLARQILAARFSPHAMDDAPPAPVRASFDLYELWCLLAIQRALDAVLGAGAWSHGRLRVDDLVGHDLRGLTLTRTLPEGTLELGYNVTFVSYPGARGHDRIGLTGERRPDFVVAWRPARGDAAWVVLDAKYRVSRQAITESFGALHVYRDGLRWRARGGPPRAGVLLVPDVAEDCTPWAASEFRATYGLGLWRLRPGTSPDEALGRWVLEMLRVRPAAESAPGVA